MLDKRISQVLVVSLPEDTERRRHIRRHFGDIGIGAYQFVDGVNYASDAVKQFYLSNRVKAFPNCFRCNKETCDCANNIIIPQQVANWLAFKKVWVKAAIHDGLTMVCEDDVQFYTGAMKLLTESLNKINCGTSKPFLLRMGHSGLDSSVNLAEINGVQITDRVVMSNVAFVMNSAMAMMLLNSFAIITTTSDLFIHSLAASFETVEAHTIDPLIATDLSFNKKYARFISRIHPKGLDESDERRKRNHVKRVSSKKEYDDLLAEWIGA